jgi:hypothetical protein
MTNRINEYSHANLNVTRLEADFLIISFSRNVIIKYTSKSVSVNWYFDRTPVLGTHFYEFMIQNGGRRLTAQHTGQTAALFLIKLCKSVL